MKARRLGFAIAMIIGLVTTTAGPANASTTHGGRIVWNQFTRDFGAMHIVARNADGTRPRDLTTPVANVYEQDPVYSPDGKWVAFNRFDFNEGDFPHGRVGIVAASGGPVTLVDLGCVDPCYEDDFPSWTPDAARIVFQRVSGFVPGNDTSAGSAVLWSANRDGSDVQRLSPPGIDGIYEDNHARFSPDGTYLIFLRSRTSDGHNAVFRMRPNGTGIRQLTPWKLDADLPDLSPATSGPTKDLVVFETFGHGAEPPETQKVATVPATCTSMPDCTSKITLVTPNVTLPDQAFNPAWSPDGTRIVYCAFRDNGPDQAPLAVITTIDADGSNSQSVSNPNLFGFRPDWTSNEG